MIDIYYAYARINVPTHINANIYQDKANCHIISKEKKCTNFFYCLFYFFSIRHAGLSKNLLKKKIINDCEKFRRAVYSYNHYNICERSTRDKNKSLLLLCRFRL